jgi:DNA (cytosine-5)-methyltransferase 1
MDNITFGSVCSGIEAASVAFEPLGWRAAWLAEIEANPAALLAHHYPDTPNLGDMTRIPQLLRNGDIAAPDVFCGGTPCQAFSVAGLRNSLGDARGNLSLTFCEIANEIDIQRQAAGLPPCVVKWENVPGVLSTKDNAFGCFLAGLAGEDDALVAPGGKWSDAGYVLGPKRAVAWRVLDAQYFGVAQRRRRVFVVASARNGFDPAAILLEFDGVRRDSAPGREAGQGAAGTAATGTGIGGGYAPEIARCIATREGSSQDYETTTMLAVPVLAFHANAQPDQMRFDPHVSAALTCSQQAGVFAGMAVRRLTPRECERLQGFQWKCDPSYPGSWQDSAGVSWTPDYTLTPMPDRRKARKEGDRRAEPRMMADGPRYKALGNSWAVPVVRWIGERISREMRKP